MMSLTAHVLRKVHAAFQPFLDFKLHAILLEDIGMPKELAKFKSKSKRKAEYTKEGMAILGHGRGKASDAGSSKKRTA